MTTADDLNRYHELKETSQKLHMASCWMQGMLSFVESRNVILDEETLKFVKSMDRISKRVYEVSMALSNEAREMLTMDPTVPTPYVSVSYCFRHLLMKVRKFSFTSAAAYRRVSPPQGRPSCSIPPAADRM